VLNRRQFLIRSGALAGALALPTTPAFGATNLRKMIDIGPGGVIYATWKMFPKRL
jgi:hypothetical protein